MVIGAIVAHVIELSCFAVGYRIFDILNEPGGLVSADGQSSSDYGYFSFVAYTSLGFGDITPQGPVRFMTALETLTGLILIAWTASFIFLQMQAHWEHSQANTSGNHDMQSLNCMQSHPGIEQVRSPEDQASSSGDRRDLR